MAAACSISRRHRVEGGLDEPGREWRQDRAIDDHQPGHAVQQVKARQCEIQGQRERDRRGHVGRQHPVERGRDPDLAVPREGPRGRHGQHQRDGGGAQRGSQAVAQGRQERLSRTVGGEGQQGLIRRPCDPVRNERQRLHRQVGRDRYAQDEEPGERQQRHEHEEPDGCVEECALQDGAPHATTS